ncbi:hypothetical protein H8D29_03560 [PVC group bacterium]|nr:hypothetical protein [PVC group bacterium]
MSIIGINGTVEFKDEIEGLCLHAKGVIEVVDDSDFDRVNDFADISVGEDQESWDGTLGALFEDLSSIEDALGKYKKTLEDLAKKSSEGWEL